jgi:hypothetical protein
MSNAMSMRILSYLGATFLAGNLASAVEIRIVNEQVRSENATAAFSFPNVPPPSTNDAATRATFQVVDGRLDPNSGGVGILHAGRVPDHEDQPAENFFFAPGTDGGRLLVDLGASVAVRQINSYSWHPDTRAPQVYTLYASDGSAPGFNPEPKRGTDPEFCGWTLVAAVDTRPTPHTGGGQHGVSISAAEGPLGRYRYLLFDIRRTGQHASFDNTFYSELDVVDFDTAPVAVALGSLEPITQTFTADNGRFRFTLDLTAAPDLAEWATTRLRPVVQEWYPRIVGLLPSEGWQPIDQVTLRFRTDMGGTPASAAGGRVNLNAGWFRRELEREALGAVVHELVHVVQSYGRVRRDNPNATRMPGWLVEGIADYIRWFLYEPETRGAEITPRNLARARFDASYRITGNFLDWVTREHDPDLVRKLNAAARAGRYHEGLWQEFTGMTAQELGDAWKAWHERRLATANPDAAPQ